MNGRNNWGATPEDADGNGKFQGSSRWDKQEQWNPRKRRGDAPDAFPAKRVNSPGDCGSRPGDLDEIAETMAIPSGCVGLVIGRRGEQISSIQSQTNCRVQMAAASSEGSLRQCTLKGSRRSIAQARDMIENIIARGDKRPPPNFEPYNSGPVNIHEGGDSCEILIPATKCGLVIGKGGETVRNLQQRLGVKLFLARDGDSAGNQPRLLMIRGEPRKVEDAVKYIQNMLETCEDLPPASNQKLDNNYPGQRGMDGHFSVGEVMVPRSSVGSIIGKGGETIKRLSAESGAKIRFKPDEDERADRCVVIEGTESQVSKAKMLISNIANRDSTGAQHGTEMFRMHVPSDKTGLVIGKGGETIKQICAESGANVELSRDPPPNELEKIFVIKGAPYQIHYAQHLIRIRSGQLPPGTPLPHFCGHREGESLGSTYNLPANPGSLGGINYGAQSSTYDESKIIGQVANQWTNTVGRTQIDCNQAAWQQYYAQQFGYPQAAYGTYYQQPTLLVQQVQTVPAATQQTGQPDYTAQWIAYYKSMGMPNEAAMIESLWKQNSAIPNPGSAAPQLQYSTPIPYAMPTAQPQFVIGSVPQVQAQGPVSKP